MHDRAYKTFIKLREEKCGAYSHILIRALAFSMFFPLPSIGSRAEETGEGQYDHEAGGVRRVGRLRFPQPELFARSDPVLPALRPPEQPGERPLNPKTLKPGERPLIPKTLKP
eukprot:7884253-Pyramimonas_sp.AAC.1